MPAPPADVFGIVYIIENAQQFWAELEDVLHLPDGVTLEQLDATMRRFVSFCAGYHEQYLQSPLQLEHACGIVIASDLLTFHSERMLDLLISDTQTSTDPHCQFVLYSILLSYGRRTHAFLRSQKRWQPLLPLLMDNVRVEVDPEVEDVFYGAAAGSSSGGRLVVAVPIEAKLRSLSVRLLYEVCRVQRLGMADLQIFDDGFIDYLFDLVEQTRANQDETFNYSVIKLLVALNEQFMLAVLPPAGEPKRESKHEGKDDHQNGNRVLRMLMSRVGSSATFGENLIFMLNRADRTEEDLCMQLLVLKLLYLLFTTRGMAEYFYTNDLCVLVDVFLREIGNIDESNESLRHTYLRVLHPLLTKTQLRDRPYKRAQVIRTLEGLIAHETIRDVDPTTKRLVLRCLSGDWCVQFRKATAAAQQETSSSSDTAARIISPPLDPPAVVAHTAPPPLTRDRTGSIRGRNMKATRSAENLLLQPSLGAGGSKTTRSGAEAVRHASNDSSMSLPRVAGASPPTARRRERAGSVEPEAPPFSPGLAAAFTRTHGPIAAAAYTMEPVSLVRVSSPLGTVPDSPVSSGYASGASASSGREGKHRRPPPAPPKRRKPPPLPPGKATLQGLPRSVFTSMAASSSQPSLSTTGRER